MARTPQARASMNRASTRPLTAKAIAFAHEFARDHNGSAAARRAGYAGGEAAGVTACRLLKDARVQSIICELEAASRGRVEDMFWPTLERLMSGEKPTRVESRWYQRKDGEMKKYDSETYDMAAVLTLASKALSIGQDNAAEQAIVLRIEGPGVAVPPKADELPLDSRQVVQ